MFNMISRSVNFKCSVKTRTEILAKKIPWKVPLNTIAKTITEEEHGEKEAIFLKFRLNGNISLITCDSYCPLCRFVNIQRKLQVI